VIFISCKAPVDPVELVLRHIENVEQTGITHTRYAHRLTPVSNTCVANVSEIKSLTQRVLKPFLLTQKDPDENCRYKIELKVRNHNTLSRQTLIDTVVSCVPSGWTVDLENAEIFFLMEVFKVGTAFLMEPRTSKKEKETELCSSVVPVRTSAASAS